MRPEFTLAGLPVAPSLLVWFISLEIVFLVAQDFEPFAIATQIESSLSDVSPREKSASRFGP